MSTSNAGSRHFGRGRALRVRERNIQVLIDDVDGVTRLRVML